MGAGSSGLEALSKLSVNLSATEVLERGDVFVCYNMYLTKSNFTFSCSAPMKRYGRTMKKLMLRYLVPHLPSGTIDFKGLARGQFCTSL